MEWNEFVDTDMGVRMNYPKEWMYESESHVGVTIFAAPETLRNIQERQTDPILNMVCLKLPQDTPPEKFINEQLMQMKYMTGTENIKHQKMTLLGGLEATKAMVKVNTEIGAMSFFAIWVVYNGTGYSIFFHCESSKFPTYQTKVIEMLKSLKLTKTPRKVIELLPYTNTEGKFIIRYPSDFTKKTKAANAKGAEVTFSKKETSRTDDEVVDLLTEINVSIQNRTGSLDHHSDLIKESVVSKMFVDENDVDVCEFKLGSTPSVSVSWKSNAKLKGGRHTCILTSENENSPIIVITMITNFVEEETRINKVLLAVRNSFRFLSDPAFDESTAKWNCYENLIRGFGFPFNPKQYAQDELVPMTEGSFTIKEDQGNPNPRGNFAVIVRPLGAEPMNLEAMKKELVSNLQEMGTSNLEELGNEDIEVFGKPGKVTIWKGTVTVPMTGAREEMVFLYRYFLTNNLAILFAFSAIPELWTEKWDQAKSFVEKLYFH